MRSKFQMAGVLVLLLAARAAVAQDRVRIVDDPTDLRIPRNSRVYIAPARGFEQYLAAAFRKKSVPLLIVVDRKGADFEITATHEKEDASFARTYQWGLLHGSAAASIQIVNLRTGVVVFADSSNRVVAWRGERSTAEKLAKMLKRRMEKDEKKSQSPNL
ncbi:MAG TPA: hypothetical protein VGP81_08525 [Pyrinomonadaceae bacterium]|jgi:hypothetical protein|nr:hypothetical protein [Pyrinomonadaceae bacterium]